MYSANLELVKKYIENDDLCRKAIGLEIKNFRSNKMFVNRETFSRKIDYSFCTITNVEIGKYYPKIDFLARITKYSGSPVYFVLNQNCKMKSDIEDMRLFDGCSENQKIIILMRILCEKYKMLYLYDEDVIADICKTKSEINKDNIGWLIRMARIKSNVSQEKLAGWLGVDAKKIKDIEKGNSSIPFKKIYFISNLLNVPIDYFIMDCLESKQYVINYLLSDVFEGIDDREREYYTRYIDALKYKMNIEIKKLLR